MKLVLIGGNPKGFDIPFHPDTISGKCLRNIINEIGLDCELADMTKNKNDNPTIEEIVKLREKYSFYQVIFLGRFVEKRLRSTFPLGIYLPHPASRKSSDHIRLFHGLESFIKGEIKK